jgi:hypothetical protein
VKRYPVRVKDSSGFTISLYSETFGAPEAGRADISEKATGNESPGGVGAAEGSPHSRGAGRDSVSPASTGRREKLTVIDAASAPVTGTLCGVRPAPEAKMAYVAPAPAGSEREYVPAEPVTVE